MTFSGGDLCLARHRHLSPRGLDMLYCRAVASALNRLRHVKKPADLVRTYALFVLWTARRLLD